MKTITLIDEVTGEGREFTIEHDPYGVYVTLGDKVDDRINGAWVELHDGKIKVHAYDEDHDAPVSLWIENGDITIINEDR